METHLVRRRRKGHGDARRAPARQGWAGADWAHKDSHTTSSCGGSRGPADPWSAAAASKRRDLWFFRSRKNNDNSICWQKDGRRANPATNLQDHARQANKEKINARGAGGCGVPRKVTAPGKPASQFWQRPGRDRARGFPRSRQRKGNGDARCAPARLRWAGADETEKTCRIT